MTNDCVMMEDPRVGGGGDEEEGENGNGNGNGIEVSLELSIGGRYAKSKKAGAVFEESGRSSGGSGDLVDRRQEARRKREGELKKKVNWKEASGSGGGVNIDSRTTRVRVRDNGDGGGDGVMQAASKRGKNGDGENQGSTNFHGGMTCNGVKSEPMDGRPYQVYYRNSERSCGNGNASPAFSDYQNANLLGGNTSDNGSNSTCPQPKMQQQKDIPAPSNPPAHSDRSGSSTQPESNQAVHSSADSHESIPPSYSPIKPNTNPKSCPSINYPIPTTCNTNQGTGPLKKISQADTDTDTGTETTLHPQMPCVSTTGNGPKGKTVTGFLYRYNKSEVSIVCVCHGSSFTPAEFVEHAGGIDIAHPLSHITVIPSAFG